MKRRIVIVTSIIVVVIAAALIYSFTSSKEKVEMLETQVVRGDFKIIINTTGELQAENSELITGPPELRSRSLRFSQIKIQDLIPEGTVIEKGAYVAQLDRTEADNRFKDMLDELEQAQSNLLRTKLDTTMELRNLRDELINLEFSMEEMEITLEQSKFEPPATIRQASINLDKAKRAYEQARKNYSLKVQQAQANMREAEIELASERREVAEMENVLSKFTIRSPGPGMVIYHKEWGGQKRKVGANISPWDLTIATLPDLKTMISKTYINEIDISKIKVGQKVLIGVDAFPEKEYSGLVTEVANIGEQLPNTDAKVFEVVIKLSAYDPILRPAMTTSNMIVTATSDNVLFVPLEAVHVDDTIPYVITEKGVKQVVVLGESNENEIIVEQGLNENETILLTVPEEHMEMKMEGKELIAVIVEKERQKKLEEERQKAEAEKEAEERATRARQFRMPGGMSGQGGQNSRPGSTQQDGESQESSGEKQKADTEKMPSTETESPSK